MSKKRFHTSWLVAWISLCFLAGIALSPYVQYKFSNLCWFFVGLSLVFIIFLNKSKKVVVLVILSGLIIGLWRGDATLQDYRSHEKFVEEHVLLEGVVSEDTVTDASGRQKIKLKNIKINEQALSGVIWLGTSNQNEIKRSDRVVATGKLSEGFGNFPSSMHQAEIVEVIRTKGSDPALEIRDWFADGISKVIREPEASLGVGFLTGQNSTLPEELNNNLRILGLTHIVVASGYNLTILVRFARRSFAKISKYWATVSSLFLISGFVLVTGFSPSMSRAALITGLSIIAWHFGRRLHPAILLSFTAGLTAFINPGYVWGDLGWYLSFAAFGGVIILAPLIYHYFWGNAKKPGSLHQIFLETLAAQIMTAPIIAFAFGQYAPLALLANLLILIFIPLAMILTFVAGISGLISLSLAFLAVPAYLILSYMTLVVDKLSLFPIALKEINFSLYLLIFSYLLISIFTIYSWRRTKHNFLQTSMVE